jgi:DUF4097 and DUF4098 domain-containing protein YvlB
MRRQRTLATWMGAILGILCALLFATQGQAEDRSFTEEFHQTYPLAQGGRVDLENINGAVHITAWDRDEVKVDAVKYAGSKERLEEVQIRVNATRDYVSIRTKYPHRSLTFNSDDERDNPGSVEYTLTVPRTVRLDEIKLINGGLDVSGVAGEVRASCINGRLTASDLSGPARLSTVNGRLDAKLTQLKGEHVELSSVNGRVELTLPSDASADLEASSVMGSIENNFGMEVRKHRYIGSDLHAQLGSGGTHVEAKNVNGRIEIRHADDNHAISPVRNLNRGRDRDDDDDDDI